MKKILRYILQTVFVFTALNTSAQTTPANPAIIATLDRMYKNYDSVPFMSFDVLFVYNSDTLAGNFVNEQLAGTYTMAGKRMKYTLGNIDFMQNDSFFIAVYNSDKMILVDEPKIHNSGSQLPMRQQMDSLLKGYANQYTISSSSSGDTGKITMLRLDSTAQFDRFSISYDTATKMLYQLNYEYPEREEYDPQTTNVTAVPLRKKRLAISFSNYRYDNYADELYSEFNYIFFENGVCKPAKKYEGFKVYNSKPVSVKSEIVVP